MLFFSREGGENGRPKVFDFHPACVHAFAVVVLFIGLGSYVWWHQFVEGDRCGSCARLSRDILRREAKDQLPIVRASSPARLYVTNTWLMTHRC